VNEIKLSQEEIFKKEAAVKSGAGWFAMIAVLSLINSFIVLSNGSLNFILGLGITQIVDSLTIYNEPGSVTLDKATALSINLLIASIFLIFSYFAKRKKTWAFVTGMIVYGLDGLIFLSVQDYLGFGFHLFALIFIFKGFSAMRILNKIPIPLISIDGSPNQSNLTEPISAITEGNKNILMCPNCKTEFKGNINYCTNCGTRITL
jgi:uncharacterized membrane protein HdeD (DUF308 family)